MRPQSPVHFLEVTRTLEWQMLTWGGGGGGGEVLISLS